MDKRTIILIVALLVLIVIALAVVLPVYFFVIKNPINHLTIHHLTIHHLVDPTKERPSPRIHRNAPKSTKTFSTLTAQP